MPTVGFNFASLPAPLAVLAFLATVALGLTLALAVAICLATGRRRWAGRLAAGAAGLALAYAAILLGFSLRSREVTLARGGEKYFCEIDCHLAYSIAEVRRSAPPGGAPDTAGGTAGAGGELWRVRLRTRFDETTTSSRRARDLALSPNPRRVAIVDGEGGVHSAIPTPRGAEPGQESTDLTTPLRPGESYLTTLVFDLPRDVKAPRLLLSEAVPEVRLLIDHEASFLHRKTFLALE